MVGSSPPSYDGVQRAFHWLIAALIFVALALGLWAYYVVGEGPAFGQILFIHKSIGMTVLVLAVLRILYRLSVGAPPYAAPLGWLVHKAARAGHFALYLLMVALPIAGYVGSSAGGHDVSWFGLFSFPSLAPHDRGIAHIAGGAHFWFAWALIVVLALHLAAVCWHTFIRRDEVLSRMWPSRSAAVR